MEYSTLTISNLVGTKPLAGNFESIFNAPAKFYPILIKISRDTKTSALIDNGICHTINGDELNSSAVKNLFILVSPATVFGRVVTVVVNPIYGVFGRRFLAHICKKAGKTVSIIPLLTNLNTPTAIPIISPVFRIVASLTHSAPRIVFKLIFNMTATLIATIILPPSLAHTTGFAGVVFKTRLPSLKNVTASTADGIPTPPNTYNNQHTPSNVYHSDIIQDIKYAINTM